MARSKTTLTNIDNSNPAFLQGRIRDNTGAGNGTPVNEFVYGDLHQMLAKLMSLAGINYNGLPDNEDNGYQLVDSLIALAGKNDIVYNISNSGGRLTIPTKLGILKNNESLLCLASVNKTSETELRSTVDGATKAVTYIGNFVAGDYVRLINTPSGVILMRLLTVNNIDSVVAAVNFLKAASYAQELAGLINTVATTPQTNALVFVERVNGAESDNALAIANVRNGLLSAADKAIIDSIGSSPIKNTGWFSGLDVNGDSLGTSYAVGGDITSAVKSTNVGNAEIIRVTFANAMDSSDYFVRLSVESLGSVYSDNDIRLPVWKKVSVNQLDICFEEDHGTTQNLKVHIEAIQL